MKRILFAALTGLSALTAPAIAQPNQNYPDQPDWDRGERAHYDRLERWGGHRVYLNRWVTIAPDNTATTERQFIHANDRIYDRIRLEATRGAPYIYQVAILYTRGGSQVVRLNERLTPGAGEVIRTNGEPIRRIVVYTEPRYRGSYGLFAAQRPDRNRYRD